MQTLERLNLTNILNIIHKRLQPSVLKNIQILKRKKIFNYILSLILTSLIIFYPPLIMNIKNMINVNDKIFIVLSIMINIFFYVECNKIYSYEKSVKKNEYYIKSQLEEFPNIIRQEKITSEELKYLFSLNANNLEIGYVIDIIKEKNYITFYDIYDLDCLIDDLNYFEPDLCKNAKKNINIREHIEKTNKNLLLEFEKNNGIDDAFQEKVTDIYLKA